LSSQQEVLTTVQSVHKKTAPPKYNDVVFAILGKHHWNFYSRI